MLPRAVHELRPGKGTIVRIKLSDLGQFLGSRTKHNFDFKQSINGAKSLVKYKLNNLMVLPRE